MAEKKDKKPTQKNDGKHHERKVDAAIRQLYPTSKVDTNVLRPGIISGGKRQIDTLMDTNGSLTDFEAKDYTRNIGIDTVAKYAFKLKDEQVPNGIMVSNSPYAATAINVANHLDVKLAHLIDTEDKENKFRIAQQTVLEDTTVSRLSMGIRDNGFEHISVPANLMDAILINAEGKRLPAYNVFQKLWNEHMCPSEEGQHVITLANQPVVMTDGRVVSVTEFCFDYTVEVVYRIGKWPVDKTMGLFNVQEESLTARNLTSASLTTDEMNNWPRITKEEMDAAAYGMKLEVISMLPDTPPTAKA